MKGYLVLEDKTVFEGEWHGARDLVSVGEVVFNTSMMGYQEIITDPSYFQQIVVMTTPEQGNYGCFDEERESKRVYAEGFVCVELNSCGSGSRSELEKELGQFKRPALSDIDTRALTLHLRSKGTPWGAMLTEAAVLSAGAMTGLSNSASGVSVRDMGAPGGERSKDGPSGVLREQVIARALELIAERKKMVPRDWVYEVTVKKPEFLSGTGPKGRVAVFDFGTKNNIVGEIKSRFKEVGVFGSRATAREILDWHPNGVILTNGPGDPALVESAVGEIQKLLGQVPLFGICMGHQLLSLAAGGKTYKLKFGHRGGNHPVQNLATGEIYMTSQNHGYAVDDKSLPSGVKISQINLYDKTVEGIEIPSKKAWSVQYHPEACPGPHDSRVLFDHFAQEVVK